MRLDFQGAHDDLLHQTIIILLSRMRTDSRGFPSGTTCLSRSAILQWRSGRTSTSTTRSVCPPWRVFVQNAQMGARPPHVQQM
jgi:hypothetical protein